MPDETHGEPRRKVAEAAFCAIDAMYCPQAHFYKLLRTFPDRKNCLRKFAGEPRISVHAEKIVCANSATKKAQKNRLAMEAVFTRFDCDERSADLVREQGHDLARLRRRIHFALVVDDRDARLLL